MKNKFASSLLFMLLFFTVMPMAIRSGAVEANPSSTPILKVEPQTIDAKINDSIIQINVTINNLEAINKAVAVQFRLCFNSTLLEFINVTEGPFFPYWASQQPGSSGTYFLHIYDPSHPIYGPSVIVADLILPNSTGEWNPPFPMGNGTIATLNFRALFQELYVDRSSGKQPRTCKLALVETLVMDINLQPITHIVQDGTYKIWPRHVADLSLNGKVDLDDVLIMKAAFGGSPIRPNWNPIADINNDSQIDLGDVLVVYRAYGWVQNPYP